MPKLDGKGPDGKGKGTGRKLGQCSAASDKDKLAKLGKGMGKKRNSCTETGRGKRLNAGLK